MLSSSSSFLSLTTCAALPHSFCSPAIRKLQCHIFFNYNYIFAIIIFIVRIHQSDLQRSFANSPYKLLCGSSFCVSVCDLSTRPEDIDYTVAHQILLNARQSENLSKELNPWSLLFSPSLPFSLYASSRCPSV